MLRITTTLFALSFMFVFHTALYSNADGAYADQQSCFTCHEQKASDFAKTLHGKLINGRTPASGKSCQACHGPMANHVAAGGNKETVVNFGSKSEKSNEELNEVCLNCHKTGKVALWKGSSHDKDGKACIDCHSIHGGNKKFLKAEQEFEVCVKCHKDVKSQINKKSHHPIREGKVKCSDCHNPHGTLTEANISEPTINELCYKCHTEKRGPFAHEHRPVTENCAICHKPHGTAYDKLIKKKSPYLCQMCHSNSSHVGTVWALNSSVTFDPNESSSRLWYNNCMNCHPTIHGSNHILSGKTFRR